MQQKMRLVPREVDKLVLSNAGALAQRRLARGVRLNFPEAMALISSQARRCGAARCTKSVSVRAAGRPPKP